MNWRQRWTALLSLRDQFGLAVARLRGRFNYGVHRGLAGWSLLRLLPVVLASVLALAAGWRVDEMRQEREVANLLNRVGDEITQDELEAWRTLAGLSEHARIHAVWLALSNQGIRSRLSYKTGLLAHAVLGFDPGGRLSANIAREVLVPCVTPSKNVSGDVGFASNPDSVRSCGFHPWKNARRDASGEAGVFCARFATELRLKPGSPTPKSLAAALVERMKAETDSGGLSALGEALADLSKKSVPGSKLEDSPVSIADYVELLRQPLIVGEPRKAVLDGLGQLTGQDFHGDLWQFVDWAQTEEGRKLVPSLE